MVFTNFDLGWMVSGAATSRYGLFFIEWEHPVLSILSWKISPRNTFDSIQASVPFDALTKWVFITLPFAQFAPVVNQIIPIDLFVYSFSMYCFFRIELFAHHFRCIIVVIAHGCALKVLTNRIDLLPVHIQDFIYMYISRAHECVLHSYRFLWIISNLPE